MLKEIISCDVQKELDNLKKKREQIENRKFLGSDFDMDVSSSLVEIEHIINDVSEKMQAIRRPDPYDPYVSVLKGPKWKVLLKRMMRKLTWWFIPRMNVLQHWNNEMMSASIESLNFCCSRFKTTLLSLQSYERKLKVENDNLLNKIENQEKRIDALLNVSKSYKENNKVKNDEILNKIKDQDKKFSELQSCYNIIEERFKEKEQFFKTQNENLERKIANYELIKKEKARIEDIGNYIDYLDFENKFRGTQEEIKSRIKRYLQYFIPGQNVLDIGCGRGEWLELLKAHGVNVKGIDINPKNIEICQVKQLDVYYADMFDYLESLEDNSMDGITSLQVIEHITPGQLGRLVDLCRRKLKTGGRLIFETPNPAALYTMAINFYVDPTHIRPVHPQWLKYLLEYNGFTDVKLDYPDYSVIWEQMQLYPINAEDMDDVKRRVDALNTIMFGATDYASIAMKG